MWVSDRFKNKHQKWAPDLADLSIEEGLKYERKTIKKEHHIFVFTKYNLDVYKFM